jgi:hypothetical protein
MRFHLRDSWEDEEDGLREDFEFEFILNNDNTFTLREEANNGQRDNSGVLNQIKFTN